MILAPKTAKEMKKWEAVEAVAKKVYFDQKTGEIKLQSDATKEEKALFKKLYKTDEEVQK